MNTETAMTKADIIKAHFANGSSGYSPRAEVAIQAMSDCSEADFIAIALACLDQAGVSVADQKRIAALS